MDGVGGVGGDDAEGREDEADEIEQMGGGEWDEIFQGNDLSGGLVRAKMSQGRGFIADD